MSRIGKKPIVIPADVTVQVHENIVTAKGPKGELTYTLLEGLSLEQESGKISLSRNIDKQDQRALHGLARSIVFNMIVGVSQGFVRVLELKGVGYRAQAKGNKLSFTLGYSHPIEYELPEGVQGKVDDKQTTITLTGFDRQLLGQVAANLRKLRSPDSYKGKGVRYSGERLKLKAGKTGKK